MPPPRMTTLAGATPGTPPSEHAAAAVQLLEVLGAFLHRHAAGDLGHRREQRQLARRQLDRLVGDARRAAVDVRLRELLVGREVEVGEDQLAAPHVRPLALDRLLHLHDHVAVAPRRSRRRARSSRRRPYTPRRRTRCRGRRPSRSSTECPAPTSVSAPAGTRAMRFSLVLISFGTPIFMVEAVADCRRALHSVRRAT